MESNISAKKVFIRMLIGFIAGIAVGILIPVVTGTQSVASPSLIDRVGSKGAATAIHLFLSGIMGVAGFGGTLFYEADTWNVAKATTVHFSIVLAAYLSIGLLLDWFPLDIGWILLMVGIMTAAFFAIWIIMYLIGKSQTKKLNEIQKKYNRDSEDEK